VCTHSVFIVKMKALQKKAEVGVCVSVSVAVSVIV
jgi:hypothetical protein